MKYFPICCICSFLFFVACSHKDSDFDASGNFESDEVIVAAQLSGQLLTFSVAEGEKLNKDQNVGQIDVSTPVIQRQQVEASITALRERTTDPQPELELVKKQLAVQQSQLDQQLREKTRTENLVKADAATQKQLDDINSAIDQLQKQIAVTQQQLSVQKTRIANQNRSVLSEQAPLEKSAAQYADQIKKGMIINPISGTVLTRYALTGEMTAIGKPLYQIANLDTLILRAYITGSQLSQVKLGESVTVRIDSGNRAYKLYPGMITWISDKSEFTPKTIETKDERSSLVYAIKIRVRNDGYLKIGMYGEVKF